MNYLDIQRRVDFEAIEFLLREGLYETKYEKSIISPCELDRLTDCHKLYGMTETKGYFSTIEISLEIKEGVFLESLIPHVYKLDNIYNPFIINAVAIVDIKGEKLYFYVDTYDDNLSNYLNLNELPYREHYKKTHGIG